VTCALACHVVKMQATTICGTDLDILKGDTPEVETGRILGHEGVGVITEIGEGVTQLAVGDRVILACVSSCGTCENCHHGLYSHCLNPEGKAGIGWILGYMIDGTQAEYVRIPFAGNSVYKIPDGVTDSEGIVLSDILPTGFEIGVQYGQVKPGDVVAVVGAGPGGHVANIGVHGKSVELALNELWIHNINISMGLVNTNTLAMLLKLVAQHRLPADKFVTHQFSFDQIMEAYDVFGNAAQHNALKVLIH